MSWELPLYDPARLSDASQTPRLVVPLPFPLSTSVRRLPRVLAHSHHIYTAIVIDQAVDDRYYVLS